jgi:hypothetical protein
MKLDTNPKKFAALTLLGLGSYFFFYYVVGFGWLPSTLVTILYLFLLYRSYQRKGQVENEEGGN